MDSGNMVRHLRPVCCEKGVILQMALVCSPGRWQPRARRRAEDTPSLAFAEALGDELLKVLHSKLNIRELMMKLAARRVSTCPFDDGLIGEGRELIFKVLEYVGAELPVREKPDGQPFYLAAIEELLRIAGDPDFAAFYSGQDSFAKGVHVVVGVETRHPERQQSSRRSRLSVSTEQMPSGRRSRERTRCRAGAV